MIAPWLAADAMPTRFSAGFSMSAMFRNVDVPVTTTSALERQPAGRHRPSTSGRCCTSTARRCSAKLIRRNVSSAEPVETRSSRNMPPLSLTVALSPSVVVSSMMTPGSGAPVSSVTRPTTVPACCAHATPASHDNTHGTRKAWRTSDITGSRDPTTRVIADRIAPVVVTAPPPRTAPNVSVHLTV